MMLRKITLIIAALFALASSFLIGFIVSPTDFDQAFVQVLDELIENHYKSPTYDELVSGGINGMIDSLDDPYTSYFDSAEVLQYQSTYDEDYVGIGITVTTVGDNLLVEEVFDGSPAKEAGLEVNDIITSVDEYSLEGLNIYDLIEYVKGPVGEEVTIGVMRSGFENEIRLTMPRASIERATVVYTSYIEGDQIVGYIKVTTFGDITANLFKEAITSLEEEGIDSLIIDLRDNSGGHLTAVVAMLREFLVDDGQAMFYTEHFFNGEEKTTNYDAKNTSFKSYNILTLVNGNSASASEVFVSSMAEHGGYPTIGTTTYGKGLMQTDVAIKSIPGDSLHITIGKWFTSDGNWLNNDGGTGGFVPEIILPRDDILSAYKVYLSNDETIDFDTVNIITKNIQVILNMMGYDLRTDSYYDQATKDAVLDIQSNNSLPLTGNLDNATLAIINSALSSYKDDITNDNQLQAAIDYLLLNPSRD